MAFVLWQRLTSIDSSAQKPSRSPSTTDSAYAKRAILCFWGQGDSLTRLYGRVDCLQADSGDPWDELQYLGGLTLVAVNGDKSAVSYRGGLSALSSFASKGKVMVNIKLKYSDYRLGHMTLEGSCSEILLVALIEFAKYFHRKILGAAVIATNQDIENCTARLGGFFSKILNGTV